MNEAPIGLAEETRTDEVEAALRSAVASLLVLGNDHAHQNLSADLLTLAAKVELLMSDYVTGIKPRLPEDLGSSGELVLEGS